MSCTSVASGNNQIANGIPQLCRITSPGFIGTHTALAFLDAGYIVKGTARSVESRRLDFPLSSPLSMGPRSSQRPLMSRESSVSSLGALMEPTTRTFADAILNEDAWNRTTHEEAKTATLAPVVYRASKTLAERVFWDYIDRVKF
ncbi:hypothetical protein C8F01DRAFT_1263211 [Mycena amicta]|nr:hypothetical protein C8F01DRAFT_1263211 [Mycena amicta]